MCENRISSIVIVVCTAFVVSSSKVATPPFRHAEILWAALFGSRTWWMSCGVCTWNCSLLLSFKKSCSNSMCQSLPILHTLCICFFPRHVAVVYCICCIVSIFFPAFRFWKKADWIESHDSTPGAGPIGKPVSQTIAGFVSRSQTHPVEESELSETFFAWAQQHCAGTFADAHMPYCISFSFRLITTWNTMLGICHCWIIYAGTGKIKYIIYNHTHASYANYISHEHDPWSWSPSRSWSWMWTGSWT